MMVQCFLVSRDDQDTSAPRDSHIVIPTSASITMLRTDDHQEP